MAANSPAVSEEMGTKQSAKSKTWCSTSGVLHPQIREQISIQQVVHQEQKIQKNIDTNMKEITLKNENKPNFWIEF